MKFILDCACKPFKVLMASVVMLLSSSCPSGAAEPYQVMSLHNLQSLSVEVEKMPGWLANAGLTQSAIKNRVEHKLRKSGIRIDNAPGLPYLYVNVSTSSKRGLPDEFPAAFDVNISVNQFVSPIASSEPKKPVWLVPTWKSASVSSLGKQKVSKIHEFIDEHVDEFLKDYLKANPRK